MTLELFQAVPCLESSQPPITQLESILHWNTHQVRKSHPLLTQDLTSEKEIVRQCLRDPKIHHVRNLWVQSLFSTFRVSESFRAVSPFSPPLWFILQPCGD
jgi:hypothetical protein